MPTTDCGPCAGQPGPGGVGQRVVHAVVVQPLTQRLLDVRQRAAVRPVVVVHPGVVHPGEPTLGEPLGQFVRGVEVRRLGRVRQPRERRHHVRAASDQVGADVPGREAAADEEGAGDVDAGQVGHRCEVETQALHGQPGQAAGGQLAVELGPGLDLAGVQVRLDDVRRRWGRHRAILPLRGGRPNLGSRGGTDRSPMVVATGLLRYRFLGRLRTISCSGKHLAAA